MSFIAGTEGRSELLGEWARLMESAQALWGGNQGLTRGVSVKAAALMLLGNGCCVQSCGVLLCVCFERLLGSRKWLVMSRKFPMIINWAKLLCLSHTLVSPSICLFVYLSSVFVLLSVPCSSEISSPTFARFSALTFTVLCIHVSEKQSMYLNFKESKLEPIITSSQINYSIKWTKSSGYKNIPYKKYK